MEQSENSYPAPQTEALERGEVALRLAGCAADELVRELVPNIDPTLRGDTRAFRDSVLSSIARDRALSLSFSGGEPFASLRLRAHEAVSGWVVRTPEGESLTREWQPDVPCNAADAVGLVVSTARFHFEQGDAIRRKAVARVDEVASRAATDRVVFACLALVLLLAVIGAVIWG